MQQLNLELNNIVRFVCRQQNTTDTDDCIQLATYVFPLILWLQEIIEHFFSDIHENVYHADYFQLKNEMLLSNYSSIGECLCKWNENLKWNCDDAVFDWFRVWLAKAWSIFNRMDDRWF